MSTEQIDRPENLRIGVWVEQDLDVGSGLAAEICPGVFTEGPENLTYTHIGGKIMEPGFAGLVVVPVELEDAVIEAADEQPEENIYVEYVQTDEEGQAVNIWDWDEEKWVAKAQKQTPPDAAD